MKVILDPDAHPGDADSPGCCALLLALVSVLCCLATLPLSLIFCVKVKSAFVWPHIW